MFSVREAEEYHLLKTKVLVYLCVSLCVSVLLCVASLVTLSDPQNYTAKHYTNVWLKDFYKQTMLHLCSTQWC